jgi:hypothetical protein
MSVYPEPNATRRADDERDEPTNAELDEIIDRHADPWRVFAEQREAVVEDFLRGKDVA